MARRWGERTPPKGLPPLKGTTKYLVLAATKQWNKVEATLNQDKEDKLMRRVNNGLDSGS